MQYKSETEKVAPMVTSYIPVSQGMAPANDPQIQRTRKILIIILGVCLSIAVVSLFIAIFRSSTQVGNENAQRGPQIGLALLSILFYGFGIFAAYRYSSLPLRIFAWLTVIAVVLTDIAIAFLVLIGISLLIALTRDDKRVHSDFLIGGAIGILFVTVLCVAAVLLSIIIIKFSFKLAQLIDANKNVVIQQI